VAYVGTNGIASVRNGFNHPEKKGDYQEVFQDSREILSLIKQGFGTPDKTEIEIQIDKKIEQIGDNQKVIHQKTETMGEEGYPIIPATTSQKLGSAAIGLATAAGTLMAAEEIKDGNYKDAAKIAAKTLALDAVIAHFTTKPQASEMASSHEEHREQQLSNQRDTSL